MHLIRFTSAIIFLVISLYSWASDTSCQYHIWRDKTLSLENNFILSADKLSWCYDTKDNDGNVKIKAEGNIKIKTEGKKNILSVDVSKDGEDYNLSKAVIFIDRDENNKTKVIFPAFAGVGMTLSADNIQRTEVSNPEMIELIRNYPWRFDPAADDPSLLLYPAFFRPVFNGIFLLHGKAFAYMANLTTALTMNPDENFHIPVPLLVEGTLIKTASENPPVVGINVGSWFGQDFIIPLEDTDVQFSQIGDSHAEVAFGINAVVGKTLESVSKSNFWKYAYKLKMSDGGDFALEKQFKQMKFDDADSYGNSDTFNYLSTEDRDKVTQELKDFQQQKKDQAAYNFNLFKALLTMTTESEIDYDFLSGGFDLKPVIDLSLFHVKGEDGKLMFELGFSPLGESYYLNNIGFDFELPKILRDLTPEPQYTLEKAVLKDPFTIGIGMFSGNMALKGLAQPLYDLLESGGEKIPYDLLHIEVDVGMGWVLLDELGGFETIHDIPVIGQWILSGGLMVKLKFGQTTGFSASGNTSFFEVFGSQGASIHLYFPGPDFAVTGSYGIPLLGVSLSSAFSGNYTKDHSDYPISMSGEATWRVPSWVPVIHGWTLGSVGVNSQIGARTGATFMEASKYIWFPWPVNSKVFYARLWIYDPHHSPHTWVTTGARPAGNSNGIEFAMGTPVYHTNLRSGTEEYKHTFQVSEGNEDLSVVLNCTNGAYPRYSVTMPDGSLYTLNNTYTFDTDSLKKMATSPQNGDNNKTSVGYFIYDANQSVTMFGHSTPPTGTYTLTIDPDVDLQICDIDAYVTAKMAVLDSVDSMQNGTVEPITLQYHTGGQAQIKLQSSGGMATTPITLYAQPTHVRNLAYDYWHETLFDSTADAADRAHLHDDGDYNYVALGDDENNAFAGQLVVTQHTMQDYVIPEQTEWIQSAPPSKEEASEIQRSYASIKLGNFTLQGEGVHQLTFTIDAEELFQGSYRLLAKVQNRFDAEYVALPYELIINDRRTFAVPVIDHVDESDEGDALIYWNSDFNLSEIGKVRLFVYDRQKSGNGDLYTTHIDYDPSYQDIKPIRLRGLISGQSYGFSLALLDQNGTLSSHKSMIKSIDIGSSAEGSPCIKIVDHESFAKFDEQGNLEIRMRVLNESSIAMKNTPVELHYRHKTDKALIAGFSMNLDGMAYSDVHISVPFSTINAIPNLKVDHLNAVIYDIRTNAQNELLMHDNFGLISLKNMHYYTANKDRMDPTAKNILINLKKGWNLLGDAVWDEDLYDKISTLDLHMYDGISIQHYLSNRNRGSAYFVYAKHDQQIVVTGLPIVPDFEHLKAVPWQLIGTGIDIKKVTSSTQPDDVTYTPGEACNQIFVLRHNNSYAQWYINPDVIYAGEGFWCKKVLEK